MVARHLTPACDPDPMHRTQAHRQAVSEDALLVRAFRSLPRKVPPPARVGGTSILVVRNGPYGPYRAHYSHTLKRFTTLEYRHPEKGDPRIVTLGPQDAERR